MHSCTHMCSQEHPSQRSAVTVQKTPVSSEHVAPEFQAVFFLHKLRKIVKANKRRWCYSLPQVASPSTASSTVPPTVRHLTRKQKWRPEERGPSRAQRGTRLCTGKCPGGSHCPLGQRIAGPSHRQEDRGDASSASQPQPSDGHLHSSPSPSHSELMARLLLEHAQKAASGAFDLYSL